MAPSDGGDAAADALWVVVPAPPGLEAFAGPHTLYLSHALQVTSSGRARKCALIVTCQMLFVCEADGSVRRVVRLADIIDCTTSRRPADRPADAARLLSGDILMLLLRVRGEHDLLIGAPTPSTCGKSLEALLDAAHRQLTGQHLPILGPPRAQCLIDTAQLRKPHDYRLPPAEQAGGDPSRRCKCHTREDSGPPTPVGEVSLLGLAEAESVNATEGGAAPHAAPGVPLPPRAPSPGLTPPVPAAAPPAPVPVGGRILSSPPPPAAPGAACAPPAARCVAPQQPHDLDLREQLARHEREAQHMQRELAAERALRLGPAGELANPRSGAALRSPPRPRPEASPSTATAMTPPYVPPPPARDSAQWPHAVQQDRSTSMSSADILLAARGAFPVVTATGRALGPPQPTLVRPAPRGVATRDAATSSSGQPPAFPLHPASHPRLSPHRATLVYEPVATPPLPPAAVPPSAGLLMAEEALRAAAHLAAQQHAGLRSPRRRNRSRRSQRPSPERRRSPRQPRPASPPQEQPAAAPHPPAAPAPAAPSLPPPATPPPQPFTVAQPPELFAEFSPPTPVPAPLHPPGQRPQSVSRACTPVRWADSTDTAEPWRETHEAGCGDSRWGTCERGTSPPPAGTFDAPRRDASTQPPPWADTPQTAVRRDVGGLCDRGCTARAEVAHKATATRGARPLGESSEKGTQAELGAQPPRTRDAHCATEPALEPPPTPPTPEQPAEAAAEEEPHSGAAEEAPAAAAAAGTPWSPFPRSPPPPPPAPGCAPALLGAAPPEWPQPGDAGDDWARCRQVSPVRRRTSRRQSQPASADGGSVFASEAAPLTSPQHHQRRKARFAAAAQRRERSNSPPSSAGELGEVIRECCQLLRQTDHTPPQPTPPPQRAPPPPAELEVDACSPGQMLQLCCDGSVLSVDCSPAALQLYGLGVRHGDVLRCAALGGTVTVVGVREGVLYAAAEGAPFVTALAGGAAEAARRYGLSPTGLPRRHVPPLRSVQYPAAAGGVLEFDVSPSACVAFSGLQHGDRLTLGEGASATVIGVADGMLWVHPDEEEGAVPLLQCRGLAVSGRVTVRTPCVPPP
eukprot:TRINITY_DN1737_c0_g1_i2.p1 TRINITY_DN1737_c0_g1~~TRINITY_DN1737_c0_g1_i2.p1  ORF type:complete len:1107 (+),score=242.70 TRINITY_DN1737_c0_g1_i2:71-3322(+)